MPLGMEVGFGLGDFVFDGDPRISGKGHIHPHPIFGPCLLWPNGWMDEDANWYGSIDLGPSHIVLDGVPDLCERGTAGSLFLARVCCGHGRPSQLLLSSCLAFLLHDAYTVPVHPSVVCWPCVRTTESCHE